MTDNTGTSSSSTDVRRAIGNSLRQHGAGSTRLVQAFAMAHGLQQSDLQALVAIIAADDAGQPLTPARLREHIGLSSAGATYVVDRLERAGYVRRCQDHPTNRRLVLLRYTEPGLATVSTFFGPVSASVKLVMDEFDDVELAVIERFLAGVVDGMRKQIREVDAASKIGKAPAIQTAADA